MGQVEKTRWKHPSPAVRFLPSFFASVRKIPKEKLKKTLPVVGFTFGIRDALESLAGR
jgi:hypothetical protein